jgi:hypothetical protein
MEEIHPNNLEKGKQYYIEERVKRPGTSGNKYIGTFSGFNDYDEIIDIIWVSFYDVRLIQGKLTRNSIQNNSLINSSDYIFFKTNAHEIYYKSVIRDAISRKINGGAKNKQKKTRATRKATRKKLGKRLRK